MTHLLPYDDDHEDEEIDNWDAGLDPIQQEMADKMRQAMRWKAFTAQGRGRKGIWWSWS
ncbi:MAG: hypothetical protein ACI9QL_005278 [Candidatus Omnitrophota bacterium]|jgi:hypothetical protein